MREPSPDQADGHRASSFGALLSRGLDASLDGVHRERERVERAYHRLQHSPSLVKKRGSITVFREIQVRCCLLLSLLSFGGDGANSRALGCVGIIRPSTYSINIPDRYSVVDWTKMGELFGWEDSATTQAIETLPFAPFLRLHYRHLISEKPYRWGDTFFVVPLFSPSISVRTVASKTACAASLLVPLFFFFPPISFRLTRGGKRNIIKVNLCIRHAEKEMKYKEIA